MDYDTALAAEPRYRKVHVMRNSLHPPVLAHVSRGRAHYN